MTEPKIGTDPDLLFVATAGGDADAYVSPALQQRFDALAAANAGLREALEASEAECAKVIEERDAANRLLAELVAELVDVEPCWYDHDGVTVLPTLDEARASSNPGKTLEVDHD